MKKDILNIKDKPILKYSLCVSAAMMSIVGLNSVSVLAAPNDSVNAGDDIFSITNAENNALKSMGIRDYETVKEHVDFFTPDGQIASQEYIQSVANKGNMEEYLVVKYKEDAESQKLGQIFGNNGSAMQDYLDKQGSGYTQHLDSLLDIQKELMNVAGSTSTTEGGESFMSWDPVTNKLTIKEGTEFSKVINSGDLDKLADLAEKWKELTGNGNLLSISAADLETIISKSDRTEDVNMALTANKKTFNAITKVRFTITNKNTGAPATNVSVDQAGTDALFNEYNASWVSKYKTMTGTSLPSIQSVGGGVYEMDIAAQIYSLDDQWTKILKNWTTNESGGDFLGVGLFNITPSADPLEIKVQILGDKYTYYENVKEQGTYPTGHSADVTSPSESNDNSIYTFENFSQSYYYAMYEAIVDSETGKITETFGKVPNHNIYAKKNTKTKYEWDTEYRIDHSADPEDYYRDSDGSATSFSYQKEITETYYTKEIKDEGAKYQGSESINNGGGLGDRPLYSVNDGEYVRDIWFRTQYIKYWDYKDEVLTGSEAYPDAPYIVSKMAHSSILAKYNKPLVRFADEADRLKGKVMTKEKESGWAAPKKIESRTLKETTWVLAPLNGQIRIPVLTQTGSMEGVINEAGMNIN